MKILITENQVQILSEVAWKEPTLNQIHQKRIPLTPRIYKILYSDLNIKSFHIGDALTISNMRNIIGKKNVISTFTFLDYNLLKKLGGVQTKGGLLYQIEGKCVLHAASDIMSRPDENGYRWIDASYFPSNARIVWNEKMNEMKFNELYQSNNNIKNVFIKRYMDTAEEFVSKYRGDIISHILFPQGGANGDWNEILVSEIKIHDVLWIEDRARTLYSYRKRKNPDKVDDSEEAVDAWIDKIERTLDEISDGEVYKVSDGKSSEEVIRKFLEDRGGYIDREQYIENEFNKSVMSSEEFETSDDEKKMSYFDTYIKRGFRIPDEIFKKLSPEMKKVYLKKYLDSGVELGDRDYMSLSDDLKIHYIKGIIKIPRLLRNDQYLGSSDWVKVEYINAIRQINEYLRTPQYYDSSYEIKKYYIEVSDWLNWDEFKYTPEDLKLVYINKRLDNGLTIGEQEYDFSSNEIKQRYLNFILEKETDMTDEQYFDCSIEYKWLYIKNCIKNGMGLSDRQFTKTPKEIKEYFIRERIKTKKFISPFQYNAIPNELKLEYLNMKVESGIRVENNEYRDCPDDLKKRYIEIRIDKMQRLYEDQYKDSPDDLKLYYIQLLKDEGYYTTSCENQDYERLTQ